MNLFSSFLSIVSISLKGIRYRLLTSSLTMLSVALGEAGCGVPWGTGHATRTKAVAKAHGLGKKERLLGWLYVGGKPTSSRPERTKTIDAAKFVSSMPGA